LTSNYISARMVPDHPTEREIVETIVIITEEHDGVAVEALEVTMDSGGNGFVNFIRLIPIMGSNGTPGVTRFVMSLN